MSTFADFHFLRPLWLLALLALPLLWYALRRGGAEDEAWRGAVDAHLLPHLLERAGGAARTRSPNVLLALGWVLACIALAGPAWERLPQPLFENRAARVIAFELAPSMRAQDVKPSRAERARYKIDDILRRSGDAQTALIAYAGDAYVVAPLTDDVNTVLNLVDALDPGVMPEPGNDTARAIDMGVRLIKQAGLRGGELVLVADSVSDGARAAAAKARADGVRVSVLGIGTGQGAPVTGANGGFLKDEAGNITMPRLDAAQLAAVANAGGGRYAGYTADARDLDAMLEPLRPSAPDEAVAAEAKTTRFLDRGPWLLLALVPLAAFGFRRGWLMLVPLLLSLQPQRAQAMSWTDLWQRPDQQAHAALEHGDPRRAQALAHDPQLRGTAAYRAEDYGAAEQDFERPSADAQYNLGNALAKQGKFQEAIAAYDRALQRQPGMEDAIANRKAVEDWLEQQQKQQGQNGSKNDSDKNEQRQSKNDQQQSGQSQDEQQQRADQQNGKDGGQQGQAQNRQSQGQQDGQQQEQGSAGESQGDKQGSRGQANADNDKGNPGKAGSPESQAAEQAAQKQFQQKMDEALKNGKPGGERKPVRLGARADGKDHDEKQQAVDQWLQRVPDDPGGLLRRKFQLESERRRNGGREDGGNP